VFHLCNIIGDYIISTVGDWQPYDEPKPIGYDRLFETMVFKVDGYCDCGCGQPMHNGREVDFAGYNDPKAATAGHMELCEKWSNKD
jgi:hypothetical protein